MKNFIFVVLAATIGAFLGMVIVLMVIAGFSEMILSSIFNVYYSTIFFVVGSFYTYKIIKKNQIQLSLENDFLQTNSKLSKQ